MAQHDVHSEYSAADVVAAARSKGVITFDQISTASGGGAVLMPSDYDGLTWSDGWAVLKPSEAATAYPHSGYFTGVTSGDQLAFNGGDGGGLSLGIQATSFDVKSVELTSVWDTTMNVEVIAYNATSKVLDQTFTITDKHATLIALNLTGIDFLDFTPEEEKVDRKSGGTGDYLAVDDLQISNIVKMSETANVSNFHTVGAILSSDLHTAGSHLSPPVFDLAQHLLAIA